MTLLKSYASFPKPGQQVISTPKSSQIRDTSKLPLEYTTPPPNISNPINNPLHHPPFPPSHLPTLPTSPPYLTIPHNIPRQQSPYPQPLLQPNAHLTKILDREPSSKIALSNFPESFPLGQTSTSPTILHRWHDPGTLPVSVLRSIIIICFFRSLALRYGRVYGYVSLALRLWREDFGGQGGRMVVLVRTLRMWEFARRSHVEIAGGWGGAVCQLQR